MTDAAKSPVLDDAAALALARKIYDVYCGAFLRGMAAHFAGAEAFQKRKAVAVMRDHDLHAYADALQRGDVERLTA